MFACASRPTQLAAAPKVHWVPGYVLGIWGRGELDVRDDCPSTGPSSVRIGPSFGTLLATFATLGIYTPREVRVQCRAQP